MMDEAVKAGTPSSASSTTPPKKLSKTDEGHKTLYEETITALKELVAANDWEFVKEDRGVRISRRSDASANNYMRGDMTFSCTVEEFAAFTLQVERRPEWDPLVTGSKLVRDIDDRLKIIHLVFVGQWPVYPRDLCLVAGQQIQEDGSLIVAARSVVDPGCPEIPETNVRAELHVAGWIVVPRKDRKGIDVTYTARIDLKGWLPAWVGTAVTEEAPMSLMMMHDLILADRKKQQRTKTRLAGQAEDASS